MVPMILAWYFHDRHLPPRAKHILWAIVMISIPVLMIAGQSDLGTALIIGTSGLLVLLLAGIPWRFVLGALATGLVSAPALWFVLRDYQQQRILTLWNPERDPLGAGWTIIKSKTASGAGGFCGIVRFQRTEYHLEFVPEG